MNPDVSSQIAAGPGFSALIVDPTMEDRLFAVEALSGEGFHITEAETFEQAKSVLATQTPSVLLTAIRLSEYNGLHLVLRGRAERPGMAAVVLCPVFDSVLLAEANAMKATFIVTPTSRAELVAAVLRTLFHSPEGSEPIRPPFERRQHVRRLVLSAAVPENDRRLNPERRRAVGTATTVAVGPGQVVPDSPYR